MEEHFFLSFLRDLLKKEHITEFGCIPFEDALLWNERLLPSGVQTVIVLLAPYDTGEVFGDGISAYAHIYDYHQFYEELYGRLLPALRKAFPQNTFYGFADHSPINEKDAAAKAGLGEIGCHSLLINRTYGSYVFIGSLLTDLAVPCHSQEIRYCDRCGACMRACPAQAVTETGILPERCLSALSQKKRLTEEELQKLRELRIAWGCDCCQEVCPHNRARKPTELPFFLQHRHGDFTAREIETMSEEEFRRHAFAWRGRDRITENLKNIEKST